MVAPDHHQQQLLHKLQLFKIQGRDKRGHKLLRIIGNLFLARHVSIEAVNKYLEEKIYPELGEKPFSVVYVHTRTEWGKNFPGISALRSIYDGIPINIKNQLEAVYVVHPGLQARLFLATFGHFILSGGLYGKLKYVTRLEFLWEHVRRKEIEIPEFVYDHDEELEYRPAMEYGLESDHPRNYGTPLTDSLSVFSMRCIA